MASEKKSKDTNSCRAPCGESRNRSTERGRSFYSALDIISSGSFMTIIDNVHYLAYFSFNFGQNTRRTAMIKKRLVVCLSLVHLK